MTLAPTRPKDPRKVEGGRLGASRRWSNPANRKVVHIDALTPEQRAIVLALVAAAEAARTETTGDG